LEQDGWDIEYAGYTDASGHQLPTRINLRSPELNLKLIVEHWQLPPASDVQARPGEGA
jgi:outer membrane lipoprotein LolB